jgi:hypothetical protein
MDKWGYVILLAVFLAACSHPEQVTKEQIEATSQTWKEPKVAIWYYQGTDEKYHYFKYIDLGINNKYKVLKIEMAVTNPFPYTKEQKEWRVMPWGTHAERTNGT